MVFGTSNFSFYLSRNRETHVKALFDFPDLFVRGTRQKVLEKELIFGNPVQKIHKYIHKH